MTADILRQCIVILSNRIAREPCRNFSLHDAHVSASDARETLPSRSNCPLVGQDDTRAYDTKRRVPTSRNMDTLHEADEAMRSSRSTCGQHSVTRSPSLPHGKRGGIRAAEAPASPGCATTNPLHTVPRLRMSWHHARHPPSVVSHSAVPFIIIPRVKTREHLHKHHNRSMRRSRLVGARNHRS